MLLGGAKTARREMRRSVWCAASLRDFVTEPAPAGGDTHTVVDPEKKPVLLFFIRHLRKRGRDAGESKQIATGAFSDPTTPD
ncbi:hypothetical protein MRX96_038143 [Rhipicephalus microplus]